MSSFAYIARTKAGEEESGFLSGGSIDEVVSQLHSKGLVVLNVVEDKSVEPSVSWFERMATMSLTKVGTRDLALFTRQFSTLLEAGIPLVRGLRGLAADATNRQMGKVASDVADRIERGQSLTEAMTANPSAFSKMYVSMIQAGERAGTLDKILEELAVYLEKMDDIKTKVRSALSYPAFVFIFAIVGSAFLLFKIVPTFAEIYGQLGQSLPALTRAVMAVSQAVRSHAIITLAVFLAFVAGLLLMLQTKSGRYAFDTFLIRVPVFGPIVRKAVMSRFTRTFGILFGSGLPLLESMELVKGATGNAVVARAIDRAKNSIREGQAITSSFRATGKFPEMVLQLMSTGEESGELDAMLLKTSDFYDRQVAASVQGLTSLLEPVVMVIIGGMVGFVVVAMFLPIFYMGDAVMKGGFNF